MSVNGASKLLNKEHNKIELNPERSQVSADIRKIDDISVDANVKTSTKAVIPTIDNTLPEKLPSYKNDTGKKKKSSRKIEI